MKNYFHLFPTRTNSTSNSSKFNVRHHSSPVTKPIKSDEEYRKKNKRRKKTNRRNEKMKDIIIKFRKEIEEQLPIETDFTTNDVTGIFKELIADEEIKEMIRQTLHPGDNSKCYEPKLTRAKVRELLKLKPELCQAVPIWFLNTPSNGNFVSECLSLISEEFSENSSEDEEYKPDKDQSDYAESLFQDECDVLNASDILNRSIDLDTTTNSVDTTQSNLEIEENISQRTRSKLPLTGTSLEDIEQSFNPPDITSDLYDAEVDPYYATFLRTSYDSRCVEQGDGDDENDPEYRIPADADIDDAEELRRDKSTEVSAVEMKQLLIELFGSDFIKVATNRKKFIESASSNASINSNETFTQRETESLQENQQLPFSELLTSSNTSINPNETSTQRETEPFQENQQPPFPELLTSGSASINSNEIFTRRETDPAQANQQPPVSKIPTKNSDVPNCPILTQPQKLLFEQQMRQHIQLTAMHFLQCYKHPTLSRYSKGFKKILVDLKLKANSNKKSAFYASNLDDALKLVDDWEKLRADVPDPPDYYSVINRNRSTKKPKFPPDMMKIICKSKVFLYPLLLPERPFSYHPIKTIHQREMTKSEEWLFAIGLQQFCKYVKSLKLKYHQSVMGEALKLIIRYLLPRFSQKYLRRLIEKRSSEDPENCIKYYLENEKAPPLKHFVIPVSSQPLYKQPLDLLPPVWRDYISENFIVVETVH